MTDTRHHKVKCDYGANDYYYYYKNNGGKLDRGCFGKILKDLNLTIADKILDGYFFRMPSRMGGLVVTKKKEFVTLKNDKPITNRPIDFKSTLEMWAEYPETKESKQLVRFLNKHTNGYIYKINYNRGYATFRNKSVYSCRINRYMNRTLAKKIFSGLELDQLG